MARSKSKLDDVLRLTLQDLAGAIRDFRREAGMTQEDLAFKADIHVTYLAGIEGGHRNLSFNSLMKVAYGLEKPLSVLLAAAETKSRERSSHIEPSS